MKTKTETTHSPTPWARDGRILTSRDLMHLGKPLSLLGLDVDGMAVVFEEADAELIVRAVNSHTDLLAACQGLLRLHYDEGKPSAAGLEAVNKAEAAIARSKGSQ